MAGPIPFLREADLENDFLGGEGRVQPSAGQALPRGDGRWQVAIFRGSVLDLSDRCPPGGNSVFYLAATLLARKDLDASLAVTHTGRLRAWLDGRQVIRSDPDPLALGPSRGRAPLALRAGQRTRLLLKISAISRPQLYTRLVADERGLGPEDFEVVLPGARPEPARDVLSCLTVSLGGRRLVELDRPTTLTFGVEGGYPLAAGEAEAGLQVTDWRGRVLGVFRTAPASLATLARRPVGFAWQPPRDSRSPYLEVTAEVKHAGRPLGKFSRRFYVPLNIGNWASAISRRLLDLTTRGALSREAMASVLLRVEKATTLRREGYLSSIKDACGELQTAERLLEGLEAGRGLPPLGPGVHELAYLAEQDDSAQPYFLHIPRAYTGKKPHPAIVYLHGYAPWLDKTNWHNHSYGLTAQADQRGYILICPFARSNTDFQGIGETDVLTVLRLAQQKLRIDPDRIFLVGYSMGGMGAYTLAAHYPDLWAGCVVMCGRADYYFWKDLDPNRLEAFKRHLLDSEFGWPLAENFLHLPVLTFQGTDDLLIKPEQAYRFIPRLKALGTDAQLVRLEGQNHWISDEVFSTPRVFGWMGKRRRDPTPPTVRFKTYSLRYNRAWWLAIEAFQRWGRAASVEATIRPGNKVEVKTVNVARLALRPPAKLADLSRPFTVVADGHTLTARPDRTGKLTLDLLPTEPTPLRKTPALCGPIKDAFNSRFLFVYGTSGGDEATKRNLANARKMQADWFKFAKGLRSLRKDSEVNAAEMRRSNLFLFGTPPDNAILARIAPSLPIRFTPGGYEVLGKTYPANERTGLMFIYPNPLAPNRYVVVCSGLHYGEKLGENHKYDLLPDFIIYSDEFDYDDTNAYYCAGFFDVDWQPKPHLTWTSDGRPKPKPSAAPF